MARFAEREGLMDQGKMAKLLEELGTTPGEVAASLKANGVQGVRNAVRFLNPIVRHVQGRARVDAWSLDLMQRDKLRLTFVGGRKEETLITEAVRLFLDAFNRGEYPRPRIAPGCDVKKVAPRARSSSPQTRLSITVSASEYTLLTN